MGHRQVTLVGAKVSKALERLVANPVAPNYLKAAELIVMLRMQFEHDGLTDWAGRSPEYRDLIERLYRQAAVPPDSESPLQATLRYHLGNTLREVAPLEDLKALGYQTASPNAARAERKRAERARVQASGGEAVESTELLLTRIRRDLRKLKEAGVTADDIPALSMVVQLASGALRDAASVPA